MSSLLAPRGRTESGAETLRGGLLRPDHLSANPFVVIEGPEPEQASGSPRVALPLWHYSVRLTSGLYPRSKARQIRQMKFWFDGSRQTGKGEICAVESVPINYFVGEGWT